MSSNKVDDEARATEWPEYHWDKVEHIDDHGLIARSGTSNKNPKIDDAKRCEEVDAIKKLKEDKKEMMRRIEQEGKGRKRRKRTRGKSRKKRRRKRNRKKSTRRRKRRTKRKRRRSKRTRKK